MRKLFYWSILLITLLSQSCSAPYHFDRFQKKGGKVNCITDTLIVNDTLLINGDTVIVPREHYIVKDSIHYVTRYETKYQYKIIKEKEKTSRIEAKEQTKQNKSDNKVAKKEISANKQNKFSQGVYSLMWLFIVLIVFCVVLFIYQKFKK